MIEEDKKNKKGSKGLIANRYCIIKEIGKGGMGVVYLVEDILKENRLEALKTIKKEIVNESILESFKKEFEVMTRLRHPNLVRVYDFGFDETGDTYYITMKYVDGISLKDLLKQQKKLSEEETLNIIAALCRTLEFIHTRKILHRDIKPGNVMLIGSDIKVMDFGLADLGKEREYKTKGTLLYMAPEILQGQVPLEKKFLTGQVDHRADIFASGMTLYELITGKKFYGKQQPNTIINILKDKQKFTHYRDITLGKVENPDTREIIARMMEYKPDDRYQYCSEIILAINKTLKRNYALETKETREAYVLGAGFVGRREELSKLRECLELQENNKVLMVRGRTGIGKTRLYQEFKKYCQLQNIPFLEANCSEKISTTYAPFLDILNELLLNASKELIRAYGPELKKILPYHNRLNKVKVNPTQDPKTERGILIENITGFLLGYGKKQKTRIALYLDDLHWGDEGSLEVLQELMYKLSLEKNRENNLRIYVSAREEEIENIEYALEKLRDKGRLEEFILKPFDTKNVNNYIEAVFGKDYIDSSLKTAIPEIGEKVGGNPFFLQELIKSLVERELITRHILKWRLIQSIKEAEVPGNLKEILQKRMDGLGLNPGEKKTLQVFALLNRGIDIDTFNQIIHKKIDIDTAKLLIDMERRELLTSESIEGKIEYRFAHSLIREVLEEEIEDKKGLHHHIAERLETLYRDNLEDYIEELAYHYSKTRDRKKALHYLEKAGDKAKTSYSNEKAIDYCNQLLALLGKEEKEKRIEILLKKGSILELIGKWKNAEAVYHESQKLASEAGISSLIARGKSYMGDLLRKRGDYKKALECLEDAQQIYSSLKDKENIGAVIGKMGFIYYYQGNYSKAMEYQKKALKMAEEVGDKRGISYVVGSIGLIYYRKGNYSKAMEYCEEKLNIAEELGDRKGIGEAMANMGLSYQEQGNYLKAMEYHEKGLRLSEELGNKKVIGHVVGNMGIIYAKQGNYAKALECFERVLKIAEELGDKRVISTTVGNIGNIYKEQGNYSRAKGCYERDLKISEELGDKLGISIATDNLGNLFKELKEYTKAEKYYDRAIKLGRKLQLKYYLSGYMYYKADLYFILKRFEKAKILNEKALSLSEEIKRQDILFLACVLSAKINFAMGDKETAISTLEDLISPTKEEWEIATLNYELYKMTNKKTCGQKAQKLYQVLYKKKPNIEYKEKIEELEDVSQAQKRKLVEVSTEIKKPKDVRTGDTANYFSEFINIVLMLNSDLILSELLKKIVSLSIRFIDADRGFLMLYNQKGELQIEVAKNRKGEDLPVKHLKVDTIHQKQDLLISQTVVNKVIKEGKSLFVPNIAEVEGLADAQSVVDMKLQSVMCIPLGRRLFKDNSIEIHRRDLLTSEERLGILYLDSHQLTEESRFTGENLHLLQALADQASVAIANAILYKKVNIDPLTKHYLRPYFENIMKLEVTYSKKHALSFCVLMIDIDFFKNINSSYRYETGNYVLQTIGEILRKTLRISDICARYGGDEFAVILPDTDPNQSILIAKKILKAINSYTFSCGQVTVSIGIGVYSEHTKEPQKLLRQADKALLKAKEEGHNCYKIWQRSYSLPERGHITDILTGDPIRDYRNVEMLLHSIQVATSTLDLNKLFNRIVDTIIEITGTERCVLMMVNKRNELKVKVARNNKGEKLRKDIQYSKSIANKVLKTGIPVCLKDIGEELATESQIELSLRSAMCVPLYVKENRFGVIYVDSRQTVRKFTEAELTFFAALASQLAFVIENARLHDEAIKAGKIKERILEKMVNERTAELRETQKTLVDVAHRAGMAEIASGILHNVGNVLNSVKVSSQILRENIEESKINSLNKALNLIEHHSDDLDKYITKDEKGKILPTYLIQVGKALKDEQKSYLEELSNLNSGINHVEEIITVQQNYAGVSGVIETISLSKMMDDVIRMYQDRFDKYNVKIVRYYKKTPSISVEKGKLMQVFVNLLKNAQESLIIKGDEEKVITINISEDKGKKCQIVEIIDTGIGIPKENLNRIFSYGFTTKRDSRGLGLHTSALTMAELKGKILAYSKSKGMGAKFTVIVPINKNDYIATKTPTCLPVGRDTKD